MAILALQLGDAQMGHAQGIVSTVAGDSANSNGDGGLLLSAASKRGRDGELEWRRRVWTNASSISEERDPGWTENGSA
jgi:hypothetical protein